MTGSPRTCSGLALSGVSARKRGPRRVTVDAARVEQLGDAEIEQLGRAVAGHQDVARLDVAVDDETLVRVLDRVTDAAEEREPFAHGQPLRRAVDVDRFALDVLHDDVRHAGLRRSGIEQARDVRVIERRENAPLLEKPSQRDRIDEIAGNHLDRDELLEPIVVARPQIDDAHPAAAELAHDPVAAESRGREAGGCR